MVFSVKVRGRVIVIVLLRSCGHGDTPPPLRDDEDSENVGLRRTRGMHSVMTAWNIHTNVEVRDI